MKVAGFRWSCARKGEKERQGKFGFSKGNNEIEGNVNVNGAIKMMGSALVLHGLNISRCTLVLK